MPSVGTRGKTKGGGGRRSFESKKQISLAPVTKTMRTGWFFAGGLMARTHKSPHRVDKSRPIKESFELLEDRLCSPELMYIHTQRYHVRGGGGVLRRAAY